MELLLVMFFAVGFFTFLYCLTTDLKPDRRKILGPKFKDWTDEEIDEWCRLGDELILMKRKVSSLMSKCNLPNDIKNCKDHILFRKLCKMASMSTNNEERRKVNERASDAYCQIEKTVFEYEKRLIQEEAQAMAMKRAEFEDLIR